MRIHWLRFVFVYSLLLAAYGYMTLHKEKIQPLPRPLSEFPAQLGDWHSANAEYFNQELLSVLRPSDYLYRHYLGPDGKTIDLYVGYHDGAQGAGPIHSPKNCLPGNGWLEVSSHTQEMEIGKNHVHLTKALYRQEDQQRLFLYWFMVRGRTLSTEIGLKLAEIANSVQNGQRGACFVRVSLPIEEDSTEAVFAAESFLKQLYPILHTFISS